MKRFFYGMYIRLLRFKNRYGNRKERRRLRKLERQDPFGLDLNIYDPKRRSSKDVKFKKSW